MAAATGHLQHTILDVHDDRYGNPVEAPVIENVGGGASSIHTKKHHDAPAQALEKKSSHSNDEYSQEKPIPETLDVEQAQTDSSQLRKIGRRLRPNKLVLSISCWLLVTT